MTYRSFQKVRKSSHMFDRVQIWRIWGPIQNKKTVVRKPLLGDSWPLQCEVGHLTQFDFFLSVRPPNTSLQDFCVDSEIKKIRAIAEFASSGFAYLKRYIDFARSSDVSLPRMVAEIDVIASLIKRLVPSLANLKRSIDKILM